MISKQVVILARQVMVMAIVLSIVLLFVGIGALIFIHVCIVGRALRSGFGNANSIATAERGIAVTTTTTATTSTMSKHDLDKLPSFDYKTKETSTNTSLSVDCAVCLDSFQVGDKCRSLPLCNHSFHSHCVDVWLLKTPFCPICRASVDHNNNNSNCYNGNTIERRDIES